MEGRPGLEYVFRVGTYANDEADKRVELNCTPDLRESSHPPWFLQSLAILLERFSRRAVTHDGFGEGVALFVEGVSLCVRIELDIAHDCVPCSRGVPKVQSFREASKETAISGPTDTPDFTLHVQEPRGGCTRHGCERDFVAWHCSGSCEARAGVASMRPVAAITFLFFHCLVACASPVSPLPLLEEAPAIRSRVTGGRLLDQLAVC